jgi:adenylate cyclase
LNSSPPAQDRRLVAIMFTDIVGYSSMMEQDERQAINTIEKHRQTLEKFVATHGGDLLQYYGDGSLSIFPSAIEAASCAIKVQKKLIKMKIPLRIGIHLGDVKVVEGAIYGDGVNIAARVQSLGVSGSILLTEAIFQLIRNASDIKTVHLGSFQLKNISDAHTLYAIDSPLLSVPTQKQLSAKNGTTQSKTKWVSILALVLGLVFAVAALYKIVERGSAQPISDDKSIAVLPFENLSDDPEQAYFSDGMTEDIINHLAKISALRVKSRTTTEQYKDSGKSIPIIGEELGVSYILEGSVRKIDQQLRIVAQLIDVNRDEHVWTETFDRELSGVFEIESEIATEIARVLEAQLSSDERTHLYGRRNRNLWSSEVNSYDYLLRARNIWRNWNDEQDLENALALVETALRTDSTNAHAYVLKATILHDGLRQYGVPTAVWITEAMQLVDKAIMLDSALADAYLLRGKIYRMKDINEEKALQNLKKAYALRPGKPEVLEILGYHYLFLGEHDKGARLIIKSIERKFSVKDPEYYQRWGDIYSRFLQSYGKAEQLYMKATELAPGWIEPYYRLGQLYRYSEKYPKAIEVAGKALHISATDKEVVDVMAWANLLSNNLDEAARYWSMYKTIEQQFSDSTQYIPFRHRLGYVRHLQGDTALAISLVREQAQMDLERAQNLRGFGVWTSRGYYYDLACSSSFLGQQEDALAWLDSASNHGFISLWYLENDPLLDNIRKTEAFESIRNARLDWQMRVNEAFRLSIDEARYLPPEIKIEVP